MSGIAPDQTWRDHRTSTHVVVIDLIAPTFLSAADHLVAVRYPDGRAAVYSASYFGRSGSLGFTLVADAVSTEPWIGGGA